MRLALAVLLAAGLASCGVDDSIEPQPVAAAPSSSPSSTSSSVPPETTTTTAAPTPPPAPTTPVTPRPPSRPSRSSAGVRTAAPAEVTSPDPAGGIRVSSTAYCLTGTMANGERAQWGAVAANRWPLGTVLRVTPSPVGETVVVKDRIGHGSELDFAMPGDCSAARRWGRRVVSVEVVG